MTELASQCPLCNADNYCAVANGEDGYQCWCQHTDIAISLIEQLQQQGISKRCICQPCARRAQQLSHPAQPESAEDSPP